MTLVIVDDCPLNLGILKRLASAKGANEVVTFNDPLQALPYLATERARVIIVDHSMDGMDGLELVSRLRAGGPNVATPIFMVTGSEDPGVRSLALAAGVQDFLVKPIDVAQFKTVLSGLIAIERRDVDLGPPPTGERRLARG